MRLAKRQTNRKCIVVIVCLFMADSLLQGTVLCFGADGHVELESAFHQRCNDPDHSHASDQTQFSHETDRGKGEHCGYCVDIPISVDVAKISSVLRQLNPTSLVPASSAIVATDKLGFSTYSPASHTFTTSPHFTALRTVILLV